MTNPIGIARKQQIFVTEETTRGTLVAPAAADLIVAAGFAAIGQQPSYTDSPEIVDTRDLLAQFQDRNPAGTWSFPIIVRPSGTAGDAPNGDVLYKSLMGTKTVTASTSVAYTPAATKPSFSIWVKKDHTVLFASGATVGKAEITAATTGGLTIAMSGQFMQLGWAGTDALAATAAALDTTITVDDAKKYTVGAMISVGTDDNSGAGYEVTAVNTTTNVLTVSPAIVTGASLGDTVEGFLPTGTQTSTPLENRLSSAKIASSTVPIKGMSLTITDDPKYLEDEISSVDYPTEYAEVQRDISGSLDLYFRQDDLDYFSDGLAGNEQAVELDCGDTTGAKIQIAMPTTRLSVPDIQEADPTVSLNIPIKALGSSGGDSISITFL